MKKGLIIILMWIPALVTAQDLTNSSSITITKTWSQQPDGYTYPMAIRVPVGTVPEGGFPVCILLHGNGGNGMGMVAQQSNILECHALIGPTGYQNSWNICAENSDAPDIEMVEDLVNHLQGYDNINPNQIRVLGSSNGGGLANRVFIENTNPGIDLVCAIVTQLHESQYHENDFYKPSASTNSSAIHCGYDEKVNPLTTRKYLSICNINDPIIPYNGGTSPVGVDFLPAEDAAFILAQNQGYMGTQLTTGTSIGDPPITEFSYLSGTVVHIAGNAGHGVNDTQKNYIKEFFSDCAMTSSVLSPQLDAIKIYPNPTNGIIVVEKNTNLELPYSIQNTSGQIFLKGLSNTKTIEIDLSELPSNLYFLKIGNQMTKILKQK